MKEIRIEWEGPYSLEDIGYSETKDKVNYKLAKAKLNDINKDFGVYQVYGHHPVYGKDVLLYIGQAAKQTFAERLSQEAWEYNQDYKNIKFYIGRLFAKKQPSLKKEWNNMIDIAEKILIYSHEPARNSSNILTISRDESKLKEFENVRVLNYDSYRSLMPEVSGELWIKDFDNYNGVFEVK